MSSDGKMLCLNILGYKKEAISTEEYRDYMVNMHAPLVKNLMEKYGVVQWSMVRLALYPLSLGDSLAHVAFQVHSTDESPGLMGQLFDPQFANIAPYDCVVSVVFPDIECFVRMKADPYFKQTVGPDHEKFADTKRSQMMIGLYAPLMKDGKLVVSES